MIGFQAAAHEVRPAIADFRVTENRLVLEIRLNLEALLAEIYLAEVDPAAMVDTDEAQQADVYTRLRSQTGQALAGELAADWDRVAGKITILADNARLTLNLTEVLVPDDTPDDLARDSKVFASTALPRGTKSLQIGWARAFGPLVLRQDASVTDPYTGYLQNGEISPPIQLAGGDAQSALGVFWSYGKIGFVHIVPKGVDHILFVLGLFLLSLQLRPLLMQVTAFTLAHTVTLALGMLGIVTISPAIVEPLIALSIVYVAVENIVIGKLSPWRPFVVFGFGLLHGLGFAAVLGEIGLNPAQFVTGLIGFNLGVEVGQLFIIAVAFALIGYWFRHKPWYRSRITNPASAIIALVALYWTVERVFF